MCSYEKNKILSLIYRIFQAEDYRWGIKNTIPNEAEIKECVNNLEEYARKIKDFSESGRILVKYNKEVDVYDYYLHLGGD